MKGLGVDWPGQTMMKWEQFERRGMHDLKYGTPLRKTIAIAQPLAIAGLTVAGLAGARALWRMIKERRSLPHDAND